jgi:Zn-dependent M28 family amino/carboxypeptidase
VVFVGYGLEDKSMGIDDYRGLDVRGKIVAMLWGTPAGLPGEAAAALQREKGELAAAKGAVGVLTVNTPVRETVSNWSSQVEGGKIQRMRWIGPDGRPHDPSGSAPFSATLDRVAAEALFAGTPYGNGGLFRMIVDRSVRPIPMALPARVSVERFGKIGRARSANVIGFVQGSDPVLGKEVVLLTAHLDHLGIKPDAEGDAIYNGALDNASGIATMLEAARAFAESGERPKRSVAFLAVTAEEKGLLGSEFAANNPLPPGLRPVANVNLDMPILLYEFADVIAFGAEHSTMGQTIGRAIAQMGVALTPDPVPEQNIFVRSDHYNFVRKGVPSVFLKPGIHNGGRAADEKFRKTNYHKVSDDLSQPLSWSAGAKFAKLNYLVAWELANATQVPRWYEGDYFGERFAKEQPKAKR